MHVDHTMEPRQKLFISKVISLNNGSNRALLECALKEYVMLEGVDNFFHRPKAKPTPDRNRFANVSNSPKPEVGFVQKDIPVHGLKARRFTPEQEKAKEYIIEIDRKTWDTDYNRFQQACDDILYFVKTYGNREFNELRNSDNFKKAEARGRLIDDYIRVNPIKRADERHAAYQNIMDSVCNINPRHKALVETIMAIYECAEGITRTRVVPLVESSNRDYAVSQLKSDMDTVEMFISKHGVYPWDKFIKSRDFQDVYITSASKNPAIEKPEQPEPKVVDTVKDAYQSGSMNAMEAVDGPMKKLDKYLGKEQKDEIKDEKGYIDTNKKAFNYFKNPRIVEGSWAVHFTNDKAYPKIKKNGFSNGTLVLDHLAYTTTYEGGRGKDGWLFALPVGCSYLKHYDLGYGDCAFLIKSDGVVAKHVGEQDDELIFRNKDVIKKIPFRYDHDAREWVVEPDDGSEERFSTIGQVIEKFAT